jgi:uncharacterized Ntn-hydrolase superfamily protein
MTLSIAARCARTGMLGAAVTSSSIAVASRCAHARAGVGAALTQNVTDPALGPRALDLMALGATAAQARDVLARPAAQGGDPRMERRQLALVDAAGGAATFTGARVASLHGETSGPDVACAANLLAAAGAPAAMRAAFEGASGALADRLLAALLAGRDAGGETQPLRSAGLVIVDRAPFPFAELRVDWVEDGDCPLRRLSALWALYRPQMDDFARRAVNPDAAPLFPTA